MNIVELLHLCAALLALALHSGDLLLGELIEVAVLERALVHTVELERVCSFTPTRKTARIPACDL